MIEFFNREKDIIKIKNIVKNTPNTVYFIYGPINSGKTSLLMKVFEDLPDDYRVFYINFRGIETRKYEDFVNALFTVKHQTFWEKVKEKSDLISAGIQFVEKVAEKLNYTFPVPKQILMALISGKDSSEQIDCFKYLEELMRKLREKGKKVVFVLDELQMLKELKKNGYILHDLFNFLVRITKETHLCHCLCATSDCLFIEEIFSNARLEGRAKFILIDDLDKNDAFYVYDKFKFEKKEIVWDYIGGKIGDMINLYEEKKQGYSEEEGLKRMLKMEIGRIRWLMKKVDKEEREKLLETLNKIAEKEVVNQNEINENELKFLINKNILFYDPLEDIIRPQGKIIWNAIREVK